MNIIQFTRDFPDEASCRSHFRTAREREGIVCKKCGCKKHWWLKNKDQWKCSACDFRTTIRSGTFMQGSNLGLYQWYLAMAFMSFSKKGISASELQRQMGIITSANIQYFTQFRDFKERFRFQKFVISPNRINKGLISG